MFDGGASQPHRIGVPVDGVTERQPLVSEQIEPFADEVVGRCHDLATRGWESSIEGHWCLRIHGAGKKSPWQSLLEELAYGCRLPQLWSTSPEPRRRVGLSRSREHTVEKL